MNDNLRMRQSELQAVPEKKIGELMSTTEPSALNTKSMSSSQPAKNQHYFLTVPTTRPINVSIFTCPKPNVVRRNFTPSAFIPFTHQKKHEWSKAYAVKNVTIQT